MLTATEAPDDAGFLAITRTPGFYDRATVLELTTLKNTTLWRRIREGDFPKPVKLSPGRVGWPKQAVHDWIARKTEAADAQAAA